VEQISRERGAHSVSDFVRSVLTTWGLSVPNSEPCTCEVVAQVAALQRQVDWLSHQVSQSYCESEFDSTSLPPETGEKCQVPPTPGESA